MRFASIGSPVALLSSACSRGRTSKRRERGFTLIEALAAIVILALALSALLSAHDGGLRGITALDDHLRARLLAQSLLAQWSQVRVSQGPSQGHSGRFAWTVSVAPFAEGGGTLHREPGFWMLHELTVTVAWARGRQIRLSTLRLMQVR